VANGGCSLDFGWVFPPNKLNAILCTFLYYFV